MSSELIQAISTGGAGVAVIVVTLIFLRFINNEREQLMKDRRDERSDFLQRLGEVAEQLELLTVAVKKWTERHPFDRTDTAEGGT